MYTIISREAVGRHYEVERSRLSRNRWCAIVMSRERKLLSCNPLWFNISVVRYRIHFLYGVKPVPLLVYSGGLRKHNSLCLLRSKCHPMKYFTGFKAPNVLVMYSWKITINLNRFKRHFSKRRIINRGNSSVKSFLFIKITKMENSHQLMLSDDRRNSSANNRWINY